jgi:small subunit ribosomal protein S16
MLAIKLKPVGKKHQKTYRVVVAEKRSKLDGRFVADLGWVNPHADTHHIDGEKVTEWIKNGAQPTPSVHNLLVKAGIINAPKIPVHSVAKKKKEEGAA